MDFVGGVQSLSRVQLFVTPWTLAHQAFLSSTSRVCSNSCPLSWWCYLTISSSMSPFSFCLQSFPVPGSFSKSEKCKFHCSLSSWASKLGSSHPLANRLPQVEGTYILKNFLSLHMLETELWEPKGTLWNATIGSNSELEELFLIICNDQLLWSRILVQSKL